MLRKESRTKVSSIKETFESIVTVCLADTCGTNIYSWREQSMRPLFTVHAGEYLVGSFIERSYPDWNVWVPSKDSGVDLLLTDSRNRRSVSIQIKYSKDFRPAHLINAEREILRAIGWWTLDPSKISKSAADFWVFVLTSFVEEQTSFIIFPPAELLRRFQQIHRRSSKRIQSYLWVTKNNRCWEVRGLKKADRELLVSDRFSNINRDLTVYLDAWEQIENKLK
jgi:hypothetical protein